MMKRINKNPSPSVSHLFIASGLTLGLALLSVLTGCSGLEAVLYQKETERAAGAIMATNLVFRTNLVMAAEARTNPATGEISSPQWRQVIVPEITYEYAPAILRTNLAPRPQVEGMLEGTHFLPVPFAGTIAMVLGWVYSAYAALRNRRVAKALVLGIESGRRLLLETPEGQRLDARIKDALVKHQEWAGALGETRRLVERYTGTTHPGQK